jgi:glutaredoxin 3
MAVAEVIIYTTAYCPYCIRAKQLLSKKSIDFREVNVEGRQELRSWLQKRTGQRTVPQVFVNGRALGGFSDISALDQKGQLDPLLARPREPSDPQLEFAS